MRKAAGTISAWQGTRMPASAPLAKDVRCDVCVIGAGIAGLTCAYLLAKEGKQVIVLERDALASGETSRTTAHLASACDDRFVEMERLHGQDGARVIAQSHAAAIDRIEAIIREERIACDFARVPGYLFLHDSSEEALLVRELVAARSAGLEAQMLASAPLTGFDTGPCLAFPEQARMHPLKYLEGLARALARMGVRLHARTPVTGIKGGAMVRVRTAQGRTVSAAAAIVATNSPINTRAAMHTKQAPYRTYAIAAQVPRGSVPDALFWDTQDPYHYVRIQPGTRADLLIVGGEDHKAGEEDARERFSHLEEWARERFPGMGKVAWSWSGQVMEPVDGVAMIGKSPGMGQRNIYVVTGDSGQGMTHGTIAGMLLTDLIAGRENPWAALYDPSRITLRAAAEFAKEGMGVVRSYVRLLTPGEVRSAAQVPRGMGAIVREGMSKLAVYRDAHGRLHERSAICTHAGCVVGWNGTEKSWDCPCHGSRFTPYGEVIRGPAMRPLAPAHEEAVKDAPGQERVREKGAA